MAPVRDRQMFKAGSRVLVPYTDDKYYEAKVLKHRKKEPVGTESAWEYYVHYAGWNKQWDEWIGQDSLLKWSEELAGTTPSSTTAPKGGGGAAPAAGAAGGAGKRSRGASPAQPQGSKPPPSAAFNPTAARGTTPRLRTLAGSLPAPPAAVAAARAVAAAAEAEAEAAARRRKKKRSADDAALAPHERADAPPLPRALAAALVDDHDRAMAGMCPRGARLPVHPCVDEVLSAYARESRAERERAARRSAGAGGNKASARAGDSVPSAVAFEDDLADSLRDYFDKISLKMLLYPRERRRAARVAEETGLAPGAFLGGRHLVRLLVMLPALLPPKPRTSGTEHVGGGPMRGHVAESTTVPVGVQLRHLMRWLARNAERYLAAPPPAESDDDDDDDGDGGGGEEKGREGKSEGERSSPAGAEAKDGGAGGGAAADESPSKKRKA